MLKIAAMDVTDAESVKNAATQLKDVAVDVLINSAGIAGVLGQKTGNVDYESWAHVFDVNTMGSPNLRRSLQQNPGHPACQSCLGSPHCPVHV